MSRSKIAAMVVAAVMVVGGISMLIIGLNVGATPIINIGSRNTVKEGGDKMVSGTVDLDDFDSVMIDVSSMDTIIERGNGYRLEYMTYAEFVPETSVKKGHLTVKQPSNTSFMMFDFRFLSDKERQYYKLTVPSDCKELEVELDSSSGKFTAEGVNINGKLDLSSGGISIRGSKGDELDIHASSGTVDLNGIEYEELKMKLSSGDFKVSDSRIEKITTDMSSGSTTLEDVEAEKVDMESSSGKITLDLIGKEDDYSFDIDTSSGEIKIGDKELDDHYETEGNKSKSIKVDASSGDVTVNFR